MADYKDGLNFESDEIVEIYTTESSEEYITVTADRNITVPEESYLIGIEGDHNSNPVRFSVDRYVDGADLLECNAFYIAWQNPDEETSGRSELTVEVDESDSSKIIAIWLVDYTTCYKAGSVEIMFQAIQTNSDDEIVYEWQTFLNEDTYVARGLEENYNTLADDSGLSTYYVDSDELTEMLTEVLG